MARIAEVWARFELSAVFVTRKAAYEIAPASRQGDICVGIYPSNF